MAELIPHAARAFVANKSATKQALFIYAYKTLERNNELRESHTQGLCRAECEGGTDLGKPSRLPNSQ